MKKLGGADPVYGLSYDYYASGASNGRVQKITDNLDDNYTTTYEYDDYNRLDKAYGVAFYRDYDYDAWGNLTTVYATGAGEAVSYTLSYEQLNGAPKNNRISNAGFSYDAAGNMTNDGVAGYAYDAASRLKTTGGNTYEYDGDGRRVRQIVGGSNVFYLWSSVLGQPVVELDGAGGVYRAYVYSSGGQLMALQANDFQFYWVHPDHLGSGRRLTDTSGVVVYRAEFDPHGQVMSELASDGQTFKNSRKFTGYERDWATNLDNANARMLHFRRGRFMQPDVLGVGAADAANPQSLNRYSYVGNDPVNFVDPSGLLLESEDTIRIETWERGSWDMWFLWHYYFGWGGGSYYQPVVDGGGGGGGGQGGGVDLPAINTGDVKLAPPPFPCGAFAVGYRLTASDYLSRAGMNQFLSDRQPSESGLGFILRFNNLRQARDYVANSPYFNGGGGFGGSKHRGELVQIFGKGAIQDYRSKTRGKDALGNRSLQITFVSTGPNAGGAYTDTDQYAYNEGIRGFFGHAKELLRGAPFPFAKGEPCGPK
ncbi:MAG: RHS repeat domain-containing protein [Blastocatellia bacterium]